MPAEQAAPPRTARQWLIAFVLGIATGIVWPGMAPHIFGSNHVFHIVEFHDPGEDVAYVSRRLGDTPLFDSWAANEGRILRSVGRDNPSATLELVYRSRRDGTEVRGRFDLQARGRHCHVLVRVTRDGVVASPCLANMEAI